MACILLHQGFFHGKSRLLSLHTKAIQELCTCYDHRMDKQIRLESENRCSSVSTHQNSLPFKSVRQILIEVFDARDQAVDHMRFRCLVRVLRHDPLDICEFSTTEDSGEWEFYVRLHLEDPTGKALAKDYFHQFIKLAIRIPCV